MVRDGDILARIDATTSMVRFGPVEIDAEAQSDAKVD
jgi:hypothetical protein